MKCLERSIYATLILISGMYVWYLMAAAIDQHADQAATVIIQDLVSSNIATDIQSLRKLQRLMAADRVDEAAKLADEVIGAKLYMPS